MMPVPKFEAFFENVTGNSPHPWQERLAAASDCRDRLIRIPTGFGKTAGTILPWLYHRVICSDASWPTRLVFCLPMRTLVEQTEGAIRDWFERARVSPQIKVHLLMGGADAGYWQLRPESPSVLVGTQDMLLSRALNRGYGAGRGAWPMEFGLLHQDVLWVCDEIQLQDVGLATSAQLAAFRAHDERARGDPLRPAHTWWMSATLQPQWLETVDHAPRVPDLAAAMERIPAAERKGGLWAVRKSLRRELSTRGQAKPADIAKLARDAHAPGTLTLVIVNTVKRAAEVFDALSKLRKRAIRRGQVAPASEAPELRLVHSRFRGAERRRWATDFLSRDAPLPVTGHGRIIVCTQVIEAGVDISAKLLVTDLAPWPSLVQRFGRVARYQGETGEILVVGGASDEKQARPYDLAELLSAAKALDSLVAAAEDASPASLECFEEALPQSELRALYPYAPRHVLRRKDIDQLFDTSADLSGADVDVSRFIRSGGDRDVIALWRDLPDDPASLKIEPPRREEACSVPVSDMKDWLKKGRRAFRFDYMEGQWRLADASRLAPGTEVLIAADEGGYEPASGWSPASTERAEPVPLLPTSTSPGTTGARFASAATAEDDEALSMAKQWSTIAMHGKDAGQRARAIAQALRLDASSSRLLDVLDLAGRWHDAGKAHPVFQKRVKIDARSKAGGLALSRELAKAPDHAWEHVSRSERPGFRHELVSALALFEFLRRTDRDHPALLGPHLEVLGATGELPVPVSAAEHVNPDHPLAKEIAALDGESFDLLAWLVCSHHGKVRSTWASTPKDQESRDGCIHGVLSADRLPKLALATAAGSTSELPELELSLSLAEIGLSSRYGASWGERVCGLLDRIGPFKLAYLEALVRAADWWVSGANESENMEER